MDVLPASDLQLRAVLFSTLLVLIVAGELAAPRRRLGLPRLVRWLPNLAVGAVNIMILKIVFPMLGIGLAYLVAEAGWGLLNQASLPPAVAFIVSLLALDFVIWAQHRLFHKIPSLWRMHRMHHTDPDFDVSTAVRFHPLEAVLSMVIKSATIILLGIGPLAFLVFEVILSSTSLFNHGNLRLPPALDRLLRWVVVTPDMHRVHHSAIVAEQDTNFGFNLPWWDRLFGTYRDQPEQGHERMTIGTGSFDAADDQRLARLLAQPFRTPDQQAQPE